MTKYYTVDLQRRPYIHSMTDATETCDEPALVYEVYSLIRHRNEWPFRQFVRGQVTETHQFWQEIVDGLDAIVAAFDPKKPSTKKLMRHKRDAGRLSTRIANVLVREPVCEAEPEPERMPAGQQLVMF